MAASLRQKRAQLNGAFSDRFQSAFADSDFFFFGADEYATSEMASGSRILECLLRKRLRLVVFLFVCLQLCRCPNCRDALLHADIAELSDAIRIESDEMDDEDENAESRNESSTSPAVAIADALAELLSGDEGDDDENCGGAQLHDANAMAAGDGKRALSPPLCADEMMLEAASCASEPSTSMPLRQDRADARHSKQRNDDDAER